MRDAAMAEHGCNRYRERQDTFAKRALWGVDIRHHASKDSAAKNKYRLRGLRVESTRDKQRRRTTRCNMGKGEHLPVKFASANY